MTPGDATRAQANIDDGWPYPDNDADIREDRHAEDDDIDLDPYADWPIHVDDDPDPYQGTYSED